MHFWQVATRVEGGVTSPVKYFFYSTGFHIKCQFFYTAQQIAISCNHIFAQHGTGFLCHNVAYAM